MLENIYWPLLSKSLTYVTMTPKSVKHVKSDKTTIIYGKDKKCALHEKSIWIQSE